MKRFLLLLSSMRVVVQIRINDKPVLRPSVDFKKFLFTDTAVGFDVSLKVSPIVTDVTQDDTTTEESESVDMNPSLGLVDAFCYSDAGGGGFVITFCCTTEEGGLVDAFCCSETGGGLISDCF